MNSVAYRLTKPNSLRARSQGMTLIELMIVVIVVAILGTVAVSSYRSYLIRANRTEARMALLRVQAAQEKFFLQNNRYASNSELATAPPSGLGTIRIQLSLLPRAGRPKMLPSVGV
jgi:type IV pilus assembly protein PilE